MYYYRFGSNFSKRADGDWDYTAGLVSYRISEAAKLTMEAEHRKVVVHIFVIGTPLLAGLFLAIGLGVWSALTHIPVWVGFMLGALGIYFSIFAVGFGGEMILRRRFRPILDHAPRRFRWD